MKVCISCGKRIDHRGNRAVRSELCQKKHRNVVWNVRGSGRANKRFYQLWKFLNNNHFSSEELQVLFKKRKSDCKNASKKEIQKLRAEMLIINEATKYER